MKHSAKSIVRDRKGAEGGVFVGEDSISAHIKTRNPWIALGCIGEQQRSCDQPGPGSVCI